MNTWLNNWSLALVTFLPLAGAAVMLAIPQKEEQLHKLVALLSTVLALAVGIWICFIGVPIALLSVIGWYYEYYRNNFAR